MARVKWSDGVSFGAQQASVTLQAADCGFDGKAEAWGNSFRGC